jgi:hypothetical protein
MWRVGGRSHGCTWPVGGRARSGAWPAGASPVASMAVPSLGLGESLVPCVRNRKEKTYFFILAPVYVLIITYKSISESELYQTVC